MEFQIKQKFYTINLPLANISDIDTTSEEWEIYLADPDADVLYISGQQVAELRELLPHLADFMEISSGDYWINAKHYDEIDDSDPESWDVSFKSGNGFSLEEDDLERFVKLANIPCYDV